MSTSSSKLKSSSELPPSSEPGGDSDELFDLPDLLFDLDLFDLDLEWWCGATGQLR